MKPIDELVLCPRCRQGFLSPHHEQVRCGACSGSYPFQDGVIDLLPGPTATRSLTQTLMEWEPIVRIYESRLWRRSLVTALVLGIAFEREQELILRAAHLARADRVLDLACGPGTYARPFARQVLAGAVVGLDLSLPMLRYASRRAREEGLDNLVLIHGTALQLPFPREHFDVVNCCGALHLFADAPRVLREVQRVLKPGGRFTIAAVRQGAGPVAAVEAEVRRLVMGVDSFAPDELQSRLLAAGFGQVQCHYAKRLWLIMSAEPAGRSSDLAPPRNGPDRRRGHG